MAGVRVGGYYDRRYRAALQPYWWPAAPFVEPPAPSPPDDRQRPPGVVLADMPVRRPRQLFPQEAWWPNASIVAFAPPPPPDDRQRPPGVVLADMPVVRLRQLFPQEAWWPNLALIAPITVETPADPRPLPPGWRSVFPERVRPYPRLPTSLYTQMLQIQTPLTAPVTPEVVAPLHNLMTMGMGR